MWQKLKVKNQGAFQNETHLYGRVSASWLAVGAPLRPSDMVVDNYAETCMLNALTGCLLDVGASSGEERFVVQNNTFTFTTCQRL